MELVAEFFHDDTGFGVEALGKPIDRRCTPQAEYVNMGDTYAPTLVRDHERGAWRLTTMGDFVETRRIA